MRNITFIISYTGMAHLKSVCDSSIH